MYLALQQAKLAALKGEVPIGAVIVQENRVLAETHNLVEILQDPTAHAELLAIQQATKATKNFRLENATLYVTLEPCPMCAGAAANARMKEIVFGAWDPVKGALGGALNLFHYHLPNKPQVYGGVLEKECAELLQECFQKQRNRKKTAKDTGL